MRQVPVGFIFIALAVAGIALWAYLFEKNRKAGARLIAAERGFHLDTDKTGPPDEPFTLFNTGHGRQASYRLWHDGSETSAFQYRYVTGHGKARRVHEFSCVMAPLPFFAPHLRIEPEGMLSAIGRMVGIRDIEVESPEFNRLYRVRCDDERFAITLLDPEMIAWMLESSSGRGAVHFEYGGGWMVASIRKLPFDELFGFYDWASWAVDHTPAVLPSLYPK
jgi:hypothetical protein